MDFNRDKGTFMKTDFGKAKQTSRREFLAVTVGAGLFTIVPRRVLAASGESAPGDRLHIGCIGVGGMMGGSDVRGMISEDIYALCDVDDNHMGEIATFLPEAKKYKDFRVMLDKEYKNLDAVTITIPDHMHATVAMWAMERGLSVHCQKPLTQSVWEARLLTKAAKKYNVVTQMGNQGYSCEATRLACEMIWNGDIGDVTEAHSFSGGGFSRDITAWPPAEEIPKTLDWDLWLGRTDEKPHSSKIHPINWRGFLDYGSQMIGDWGIHQLGPANWALQLGNPSSVECIAVEGVNPVTYPHYACRMEFPERPNTYVSSGKMPPVTVYWYEGNMAGNFQPPEGLTKEDLQDVNEIFIGTKGYIGTKGRGEGVSLLPVSKMKDYHAPPAVLKRIPAGHYEDFLQACRGGEAPCSNFSIAGPFTEWLLLGSICWRFPNEKLLWDGANLRFTNNEKANEFVKPRFRKGWELGDIEA